MKAELQTKLEVVRYAAMAELAMLERRPELGQLCRVARDGGGRISPAVVQQALPGVSERGAWNVVRWCEYLGLCDKHGGLTDLGEQVSATNVAPVPEQGVYDLWTTEHPVTGRRLLHAERLAPDQDQRFDAIADIRRLPERNRAFTSVVDSNKSFVLRGFPTNQRRARCKPRDTGAKVQIIWRWLLDKNEDHWQLQGLLEGGRDKRSIGHKQETIGVDVWALFSELADDALRETGTWDAYKKRLAVPFNSTSEKEQESFEKDLQFSSVEVPRYGHWERARLTGVPLMPVSEDDANRWARARFDRRMGEELRYRTRDQVIALWADAVEDTPLEEHDPQLPDHDGLLEEARDAASFWSLAAPVDLSPVEVPSGSLGRDRRSKRTASRRSTKNPVVRVPPRSGWSMKDLMQRILDEAPYKRAVFVDRYVRGERNLVALGLLREALLEIGGTDRLEVVTDPDGPETEQRLSELLHASPKSYNDVFGTLRRRQPHDRYLLLEGTNGGTAWQMSNSPLDARADGGTNPDLNTPLRWRDLTATRLHVDELQADLARLIGGGR
jgi:hypothetical protein